MSHGCKLHFFGLHNCQHTHTCYDAYHCHVLLYNEIDKNILSMPKAERTIICIHLCWTLEKCQAAYKQWTAASVDLSKFAPFILTKKWHQCIANFSTSPLFPGDLYPPWKESVSSILLISLCLSEDWINVLKLYQYILLLLLQLLQMDFCYGNE